MGGTLLYIRLTEVNRSFLKTKAVESGEHCTNQLILHAVLTIYSVLFCDVLSDLNHTVKGQSSLLHISNRDTYPLQRQD